VETNANPELLILFVNFLNMSNTKDVGLSIPEHRKNEGFGSVSKDYRLTKMADSRKLKPSELESMAR